MAFTKEDYMKEVTDALAYIATVCRLRGLLGLFDSNTMAEHFFARFLSELRSRKFTNMNLIKVNFPAIDVADDANGECIQITSDKSRAKVQKTINKYHANEHEGRKLYEAFPKLQVLVIGKRQGTYERLDVPTDINFNPEADVIGIDELVKEVERQDTATIEKLAAVVRQEIKLSGRDAAPLIGVVITEADSTEPESTSLVLDLTTLDEPDLDREFQQHEQTLPEISPDQLLRVAHFVGKEFLAKKIAHQYGLERRAHLNEYRQWLECKQAISRLNGLSVRFALWLSNESTINAHDVEAELKLPAECVRLLRVGEGESLPSLPNPPRPPHIPPVAVADFQGMSVKIERKSIDLPDITGFPLDRPLQQTAGGPSLRLPCERLRPGESRKLAEFQAVLHPESTGPVELTYKVYGANLPVPPTGKIRIFVEGK